MTSGAQNNSVPGRLESLGLEQVQIAPLREFLVINLGDP